MEPRKRFRASISDSYIQKKFSRKKPQEQAAKLDEEPDCKVVETIPNGMLPSSKGKLKEYAWSTKIKETKPTREQVFKVEKDNIKKTLGEQQSYIRAAKALNNGINKVKQSGPTDVDDEQLAKLIQGKRKNYSREFLGTFHDRVNSIVADSKKRKMLPQVVHKMPKLAAKRGAGEIVL